MRRGPAGATPNARSYARPAPQPGFLFGRYRFDAKPAFWWLAVMSGAVLAASCSGTAAPPAPDRDPVAAASAPSTRPVGLPSDPTYRWEACRLGSVYLSEDEVNERGYSFGSADLERGVFAADHSWHYPEVTSRLQVASQDSRVVYRHVRPGQAPGPYADINEFLRVPPAVVDELRTRAGALEAFGLEGVSPVRGVDRDGRQFERFEGPPAPSQWIDANPQPAAVVLGYPITNVVWTLDVWVDEQGVVERLRLIAQDVRRFVGELRFETGVSPWPDMRTAESLQCPTSFEDASGPWFGFETHTATNAPPLEVSLDPDGRPYEVPIPAGVEVVTEHLTNLVVPNGELLTLDGGAVQADIVAFASDAVTTDFGEGVTLSVEVVREVTSRWSTILGIRAGLPGRTVDRWGQFEFAYLTDSGTGAILTGSVIERAAELGNGPEGVSLLSQALADAWLNGNSELLVEDLDSIEGDDTIIFSNGYGDGEFPLSRGFDADGRLVAVVLWDARRYPWRLAIPDGIPPPDVTEREGQLVDCLAGIRRVMGNGECRYDD